MVLYASIICKNCRAFLTLQRLEMDDEDGTRDFYFFDRFNVLNVLTEPDNVLRCRDCNRPVGGYFHFEMDNDHLVYRLSNSCIIRVIVSVNFMN